MSTTVIIVAAGESKRMKSKIPKPYLRLGKRPVLAHTLEPFRKCRSVKNIIIVTAKPWLEHCLEKVVKKYSFTKVSVVCQGGKERQDSVRYALHFLPEDTDLVMIHDGARPLVSGRIIRAGIRDGRPDNTVCT